MRKVTEQTVKAFLARKARTVGNTHTDGEALYLHNNLIARWVAKDLIEITDAGWRTVTTKERLNGLLTSLAHYDGNQWHNLQRISQRNFEWFINGEPWVGTAFIGLSAERKAQGAL